MVTIVVGREVEEERLENEGSNVETRRKKEGVRNIIETGMT